MAAHGRPLYPLTDTHLALERESDRQHAVNARGKFEDGGLSSLVFKFLVRGIVFERKVQLGSAGLISIVAYCGLIQPPRTLLSKAYSGDFAQPPISTKELTGE